MADETSTGVEVEATTNDGHDGDASKEQQQEQESLLESEKQKAKEMKISELKMKLTAMGILTHSFCEKSEFIQAYAKAMVEKANNNSSSVEVEDVIDDNDDNVAGFATGEFDNDDENPLADMPVYVQKRVLKLKDLHEERETLLGDYLKERAQLEVKYQSLYQPLYKKRSEIVRGDHDKEIDAESEEGTADANVGDRVAGVPQFWVCALGHMDVVAELITENDVGCLEYLQDITCKDFDNGEGFLLEFYFAPNDYFYNTVLTKKYDVPNLLLADEPILKDVDGCEIQWKSIDKTLTSKQVVKQQRGTGKNKGQIRTVKKTERQESFFHFFQPPKMPSMEEMNDQVAENLEMAFDQDYDIAQAFRSHIIPKAALWFMGNAMEREMAAAMQDMEDSSSPWLPNGAAAAGGNEENPPECKQS